MENCIFCKIIKGEIPSYKVYEDEHTYAFMDINPINPGHLLVIPKTHYAEVKDFDEETGMNLFRAAVKIEKALRKSGSVKLEGTNFLIANGPAAGQEVFHSHLHIIPRFTDDSYKVKIERKEKPTMEDLKHVAEEIRKNI